MWDCYRFSKTKHCLPNENHLLIENQIWGITQSHHQNSSRLFVGMGRKRKWKMDGNKKYFSVRKKIKRDAAKKLDVAGIDPKQSKLYFFKTRGECCPQIICNFKWSAKFQYYICTVAVSIPDNNVNGK